MTCIFLVILFGIWPYHRPITGHTDHMDSRLLDTPTRAKWTPQPTINPQDIDATIESMGEEILSDTHSSATNKAGLKLDQLCGLYSDLCNKTSRE